jgi:phenylpropionate dioxygenase-like ring-hydroxylating dioxygenase large terminal subunit
MAASSHVEVARRLLANVEADTSDQSPTTMHIPVRYYRDPERWEQEMEMIFRRVPLIVALSCDLREPGDWAALEIARRPILVIRGNDGVARTFLNVCRHRGAEVATGAFGHGRRFTCPYHAWVYDTQGALVGLPGRETYGEIDVDGLVQLPTQERVGLVLATLTPGLEFDADEWLGDMASALALFKLDELYRYPVVTELESPNWKVTADGYVDGYHIGFLHRETIGAKAITNRNTYDFYGPHIRVGFANKPILDLKDVPEEYWPPALAQAMSMVHYTFPNVSMSGQPTGALMLSRLLPGPTYDKSITAQYHYFREPVEGDEALAKVEERRQLYAAVTGQEDFLTGFKITKALDSIADDVFRFGRNERGNQHLQTWINALVEGREPDLPVSRQFSDVRGP